MVAWCSTVVMRWMCCDYWLVELLWVPRYGMATALHTEGAGGRCGMVQLLIEKNADIEATDETSATCEEFVKVLEAEKFDLPRCLELVVQVKYVRHMILCTTFLSLS